VSQLSPTLSYLNLTQSTSFRVVVKNGVCAEVVSDSTRIRLYPAPQAKFAAPNVCMGEITIFLDSSTLSEGAITLREWNFGDGFTTTQPNPQHLYTNPITYTATLKVTGDNGCAHQTTRTTTVFVLPKADFEASAECVGTPNTFTSHAAIASIEPLLHAWRFEGEGTSSRQNPQFTFAGDGSKQVWLVVQSATGGCKDSVAKLVTVYPLPRASAGLDTSVELGYGVALQAGGGAYYRWSEADGLTDIFAASPTVTPSATTQYVVRVEDVNGCIAYDSVTVNVRPTQRIVPSTIVTPDGNGENDTWTIRNIESYPDAQVRVLSSRGVVVLNTTRYRNDWDVRNSSGDVLPDGTYYYIITFADTGKVYKGALTVMRGR